jgi:hypothetical protein
MFHNGAMNIRSVAYMEWAKARPAAAVNLSLSGLAGPALADLGIDWNDMALNGEHPYGYPPLLEAIAARQRLPDARGLPGDLFGLRGIGRSRRRGPGRKAGL